MRLREEQVSFYRSSFSWDVSNPHRLKSSGPPRRRFASAWYPSLFLTEKE